MTGRRVYSQSVCLKRRYRPRQRSSVRAPTRPKPSGWSSQRDAAEVHAEEAGDDRRHDADGRPRRDLAGVLVLPASASARLAVSGVLQQLVHGAARARRSSDRASSTSRNSGTMSGSHPRHALGRGELLDRRRHRLEGDEEVEHLADQEVDPLRRLFARLAEDVALDLPHVVLEALDHRLVRLHDVQQRGLQHGAGAAGQPLGVRLELLAHAGQRRGLAVAHAEQVVAPA